MKKRYKTKTTIDKSTLLQLANPKKVQIIEILKKKKKQNQLDLKKKLDISYDETRRYVNALEKQGFLKKKTEKKERGSPVFLSLRKRK